VDGKPLFMIYRPMDPDIKRVTDLWRGMAERAGLPGLHLVGFQVDKHPDWIPEQHGFDASVRWRLVLPNKWVSWEAREQKVKQYVPQFMLKHKGRPGEATYNPTVYDYGSLVERIVPPRPRDVESYPCVIPNWDNTPRSKDRGIAMHGSTPELFRKQLRRALDAVEHFAAEHRIVVVKSWNEWAEGNHLEPDLRNGHRYLEALRDEMAARPKGSSTANPLPPDALAKADRA
jgi:hypothetical protein